MPTHTRRARPDDLDSLAALAEATFRAAFAAQNDPAELEAYVREAFSRERVRGELHDEANVFLLATDADHAPIGYGKLRTGPADPSVTGPAPIEIERIYVHPGRTGRGLGSQLMRALLDEAGARGFRTAWLGVWERNERAIRFYESWGFTVVGAHAFHFGAEEQTDVVMQRSVS